MILTAVPATNIPMAITKVPTINGYTRLPWRSRVFNAIVIITEMRPSSIKFSIIEEILL